MGVAGLIGHVTVVPGSFLAGGYLLKSVLRAVLASVATFGRGDVARQAENVLRILVDRGRHGC